MSDELRDARSTADFAAARILFREYADSLGVDLCFQSFDRELATLETMYAPPDGALILAGGDAPGGCVALRRLPQGGASDAELKRLYVRPCARGDGTGRHLTVAAIERARAMGFTRLVLDTLPSMEAARRLYLDLGFVEIAPYYKNPVAGVLYLQLLL